jgi:hypothetical protein
MSTEANVALLRRFEPVFRYTRGERFFPLDAECYVRNCSLWVERQRREPICLVPHGKLTLADLAAPPSEVFGSIHYLKFVDPLSAAELASYTLHRRHRQPAFHAGRGRLARVGYMSRFVDALFSIGLLARGRVPGDAAAAAVMTYQRMQSEHERYCYYGRVVRQNGWLVLQYWFFYPFNNWRSGFSGANDHEADWEMLCIYLSESRTGEVNPEWVAYASHDYSGDDLRRRWDDPELEKVGEHPVSYVAAGSHANYFSSGEYLTELELRFLSPLAQVTERLQSVWHEQLRQYRDEMPMVEQERPSNLFRIPFVDYARGNGLTIGPGQQTEWTYRYVLDPVPGWVKGYRGLWGLYTRDPFAGEDAPAGPMYNRDGTIRHAWHDPVGWAGMDKVVPQSQTLHLVVSQQADVSARQADLQTTAEEKCRQLQGLGVEAAAMHGQRHLTPWHAAHRRRIGELSRELERLRAQQAADQLLLEALERYAGQLQAGESESPRAHLRRPHQPASHTELRFSRVAELWAAISIGVMMVSFIGLVLFARAYLVVELIAIVALFVFLEAGFRGRLIRLLTSATIGLAIVAAVILLYEFFWQLIVLAVLVAGGYILWENLRELRT